MSIIKKTVVYKKNRYDFIFQSKFDGDREKCLITVYVNGGEDSDFSGMFLSYYGDQIGIDDSMFQSVSDDFIGEYLVIYNNPDFSDIDEEREKILDKIKIKTKILN